MSNLPEPPSPQSLRFAGFTLDLLRRGLYKHGERVHLTPRPLETLIVLVENRGAIVEKQRLLDTVWGGTFVTDDVLVQAIREIRRALDDDKDDPRFIQTVPRQGYRFVAEVEGGAPAAADSLPARVKRRSTGSLAAWGLPLLATVLAGGWWIASRGGSSRPPQPPAPVLSHLRQLTTVETGALKPVFAPDGRSLLFVGERSGYRGGLDLFVMRSEGGEPQALTEGAHASGDLPVFTADGGAVVFSRYRTRADGHRVRDLWSVTTGGGTPVLFMAEASGAGFSPDGRRLAYTKHLPGRNVLRLAEARDLDRAVDLTEPGFVPRFSPDGRLLAFTTSNPEGGLGELWVMPMPAGEPRRLTQGPEQLYGLAWTADSRALIYAGKPEGGFHLWRVGLDGAAPIPLTAGLGEYSAPTLSPDGQRLAFCHVRSVKDLLVTTFPGGGAPHALTQDDDLAWPRLSPDARQAVAVSRREDPSGRLVLFDLTTGRRQPLGTAPAQYPVWWDADRVAYLNPGPARTEVRAVSLGSRTETVVALLPRGALWLAVQAGGKRLAAVVRGRQGRQAIALYETGGSAERVLAEGGDYEGLRFTPDGSTLVWSGAQGPGEASPRGIFRQGLDDKEPRRITEDGRLPIPLDGERLLQLVPGADGDAAAVVLLDYRGGGRTPVADWSRAADYDARRERLLFVQDRSFAQVYGTEAPR